MTFNRTAAKTASLFIALSVGAVSCGTSLDREGTVDGLMDVGLSRTEAECIYDDSLAAFGEERILELNDDEVTETTEERAMLDRIRESCVSS